MITPSFGLTATERVLPSMALDFTTASLDSRVTFTRTGNTATVTNSSGFVVGINANLPRFDFDPVSLVCKGLLIEESKTNLILYSADINNAAWVKGTFCSITNDVAISPDGTQNADKLVALVGVGSHGVFQGFVTTAQSYTWSVYAKQSGYTQLALVVQSPTPLTNIFDLAAGTIVTTAAGCTTTITNAGNGWYRCTATYTAAAGTSYIVFGSAVGGTAGFNGNGVDGIFAWGAQIEAGPFATSYIPTVASQVTRTADVAVMTGANFSSWFNASEGAFVSSSVLSRQSSTGATAIFSANDNTAANLINCFYRASGALGSNIFAATVSQFDQTQLGVTAANVIVNTGVAYKLNDSVAYANATVQTSDTSVTVPTINQLQLGFTPTGAYLNGYVRNLRFYKQRILNAEGQAFSK